MLRLPKGEKPTYILSYPRWVRLVRFGMVVLLVTAAVVRWALAWVHFVLPLIQGGDWATQPLRPLFAAHLSLLFAAGAVAVVYAFLPDLSLADAPSQDSGTGGGLAVRTLLGWHIIPWTTITAVRIASFEGSQRRLVLVQGHWTRWSPWPRLVSMCLGAGFERGLLFTSAVRDFKPLVRRLYQEVKQVAPEILFDDEFFSLPARLVLEPTVTLASLADQSRDEGWAPALSVQAMAAVAGGLLLVQLLVLILVGGIWWKLLGIAVLIALEWVIGSLYLYAVAEVFRSQVELQQAALLYPLSQVPRALLAVPMAMLVGAGIPFLAAMVGLAGILWAVVLTALLVQQLYRLESILPAMAGGALQALFQFLSLALVLTG
jgi:hypothetical protein